jgi:uncharacterized protein YkwD
MRKFAAALLLGLALSLPAAAQAAETTVPGVVAAVNGMRQQQGLKPVAAHPYLSSLAQRKAEDLAAHGLFSHADSKGRQIWEQIDLKLYRYKAMGETLGLNYAGPAELAEGWRDSPSHRAIMMGPAFGDIGIGIARGTYRGDPALIVVAVFGGR